MNPDTVKVLCSLADKTRLSIVRHLASAKTFVSGEKLVNGCSIALSLSQPTISHHFNKLVESGVLLSKKTGTEKHYCLNVELLESIGINPNKL